MVYCMGDEADDMLQELDLTSEERQQYEAVKRGFDQYVVPRRNVTYERVQQESWVTSPVSEVAQDVDVLFLGEMTSGEQP